MPYSSFMHYLSLLIICFTINNGYAEAYKTAQSSDTRTGTYKTSSAKTSVQQLLRKMKTQKLRAIDGKSVSYKQLPIEAQRAIKKSYDLQAQQQTQACAKNSPSINSFENTTRGGSKLECKANETVIGCYHGKYNASFTGCVKGESGWECQWDGDPPSAC